MFAQSRDGQQQAEIFSPGRLPGGDPPPGVYRGRDHHVLHDAQQAASARGPDLI